jgi:hypothetical protein
MALDFVVDTFVGSDGSKYYGTLRSGVPSGLGTCIWPNQCHYDGEWRDGLMHGFGTYVWKSGQRYDGEWKVGVGGWVASGEAREGVSRPVKLGTRPRAARRWSLTLSLIRACA